MQLHQLKIIVTGGAQGMGAHFAKRLAEGGAQVAVGDVNENMLAELPKGIHRRRLDVSSETDCESFVHWAKRWVASTASSTTPASFATACS